MVKFCNKCNAETERGAEGRCKPCRNARVRAACANPDAHRQQYGVSPEAIAARRARNAARMRNRSPEKKASDNAAVRARRQADPRKAMLLEAKKRAKAKGIPCTLTLADIVIPKRCPWLGVPLSVGRGKPHRYSPSLDELRYGGGYVQGNVVVISRRANTIKNDATLQELELITEGVRRALCDEEQIERA